MEEHERRRDAPEEGEKSPVDKKRNIARKEKKSKCEGEILLRSFGTETGL